MNIFAGIIIIFLIICLIIQQKNLNKSYEEYYESKKSTNAWVESTVRLQKDKQYWINEYQKLVESIKTLQTEIETVENHYQQEFAQWKLEHERTIRKDANERSRAVIRGQATEHLAPYMVPDLDPKDYRFVGGVIDYIVFDGLNENSNPDTPLTIYLLDIKAGNSSLSSKQRAIRNAIQAGRVAFAVHYPDKETIKIYRSPTLERLLEKEKECDLTNSENT